MDGIERDVWKVKTRARARDVCEGYMMALDDYRHRLRPARQLGLLVMALTTFNVVMSKAVHSDGSNPKKTYRCHHPLSVR